MNALPISMHSQQKGTIYRDFPLVCNYRNFTCILSTQLALGSLPEDKPDETFDEPPQGRGGRWTDRYR